MYIVYDLTLKATWNLYVVYNAMTNPAKMDPFSFKFLQNPNAQKAKTSDSIINSQQVF